MEKWQRSLYQPNLPLGADGTKVTASKAHITLSKEAAKEGMVLLKNNESLLPFQAGTKLALFGKGSFDYVKGGGGSGDVTVAYTTNLYEGFKKLPGKVEVYEALSDYYRKEVEKQYEAGAEPGMTVEPAFPEETAKKARSASAVFPGKAGTERVLMIRRWMSRYRQIRCWKRQSAFFRTETFT